MTTTQSSDTVKPQDLVPTLQLVAGDGVSYKKVPLKPMSENEVQIENRFGYISAGTELTGISRSQNEQPGASQCFSLGYSQSGIVTRVGANVKSVSPGDRVVAIGAGAYHASTIVVAQNLVVPLPECVSLEAASMMAMYCFALQGISQIQPRIGQNVVIFGAGMMGQLSARFYLLMGCRVFVMDSNSYRLKFLPTGVVGLSIDHEGWNTLERMTRPYGVEIAAVCFGGDATETVDRLKPLMSQSPDGVPHGSISFPGGARLTVTMATNMGNLRLISSAKAGPGYRDPVYEAGNDYPMTYVPVTVRRNIESILCLISDGRLGNLETLITHKIPFSEAKKGYELLQAPDVRAMAVLLQHDVA